MCTLASCNPCPFLVLEKFVPGVSPGAPPLAEEKFGTTLLHGLSGLGTFFLVVVGVLNC